MLSVESQPRHIIRSVIDTTQDCNLRCKYCHPGNWSKRNLPSETIENTFSEIERQGLLEATLTGGEVTLHPEFQRILESTHILDQTIATLITNGTTITTELADKISRSNIARICTSIDGPTSSDHDQMRGVGAFEKAVRGLEMLNETGKPITVISVAHHQNYKNIIELSHFLAKNKLASQHHICAPSYSGQARKSYDDFRLRENEFFELQAVIDDSFQELSDQDLFVTFNSFWPATGERAKTNNSRMLTLVQLTEQLKDCYVIIRPNGDLRLTSASWGRDTVGNAVVGNLINNDIRTVFAGAENAYSNGLVKQLPREIEAAHKFEYGQDANLKLTDAILDEKNPDYSIKMIPIKPLSESDLFQQELSNIEMLNLASIISREPNKYRLINIADNSYILFDKISTHVFLLKPDEVSLLNKLIESKNREQR